MKYRLDRMRAGQAGGRTAWLVLIIGMLVSTGLALWFGRDTSFSTDEYNWLAASSGLSFSSAFNDHLGHLILVPRLVYKVIFEILGTGYLPFRLLALGSIFLSSALLFIWARRRVPDFVALGPCLILLVFPSDIWHYLEGNGFTVMFAVACGLAAWIAFDRNDRVGDIVAFALLCLGIATYTTALPFAAALALICLLDSERRWRSWVGLVPLVLYFVWRTQAGVAGEDTLQGGTEWDNLLLLPSWTFQSIGGILSALSGLHFDFTESATVPAGALAGPVLGLIGVIALGWRIREGRTGFWFWVALAAALALFASQVLVWGPNARTPAEPRYLYPGAVMLLLVMAEAARGLKWSRTAFISLWSVVAISLMTSVALLQDNTEWLALWADQARADITAISLVEAGDAPPAALDQPRQRILPEFDADGGDDYGYLGFTDSEVAAEPWIAQWVDEFLGGTEVAGATADEPGSTLCLTVRQLEHEGRAPWFLDGKTGKIAVCRTP